MIPLYEPESNDKILNCLEEVDDMILKNTIN